MRRVGSHLPYKHYNEQARPLGGNVTCHMPEQGQYEREQRVCFLAMPVG